MGQSTDLLVVILIVAVVAVVLDGLRRKWRNQHDRVVMNLDPRCQRRADADEEDSLSGSPELPNGGARTVARSVEAPTSRKAAPKRGDDKPRAMPSIATTEHAKHEAVPVLMDAVDVEETDIEHANVFASVEPSQQFTPEAFDDELSPVRVRSSNSNVVEDKDMLDAQIEGLEPLQRDPLAPQAGRKSDYDDDEDEFEDEDDDEDEDDWDDEDEDEEDDDEDEDDHPRRRRTGDDDEDEEWDDDDEEDDWDDEDEDDEEDDEDDDEEEDWDDEDEDDDEEDKEEKYRRANYENEPALLEKTYARAASHFTRQNAEPPPARIEPGFGDGDPALGDSAEQERLTVSFNESLTQAFTDERLFARDREEAQAEDPITTATAAQQSVEKAPEPVAKVVEQTDAKDKRAFFTLLGRHQQVELFQDEAAAKHKKAAAAAAPAQASGPREVLIINVMARAGQHFQGADLLAVLRQQGLQLGAMSIFHRHEQPDGSGPILFSMANMVKPGTFDLSAMDTFTTPGVSLFLQLPCRFGNMAAFDLMLGVALALRERLDGELKDEHRSVFTRQTIEHVRQRIRDFELALLSHR
ncbi:MAG: cell division protein ZipA [Pseudomonadales bacterium]|jgi:cell division protein ZipA|nr:cell division protein ZipA [Pseudomonadales bacterium]